MTTTNHSTGLLAVPTTDRDGSPCLGVPLSGARGAGKLALLDEDGLTKLSAAGARSLSLSGDGRGREYVVFHRPPERRITAAARIVAGAPIGHRVEHARGDHLDLRPGALSVRKYADAGAGRVRRRAPTEASAS